MNRCYDSSRRLNRKTFTTGPGEPAVGRSARGAARRIRCRRVVPSAAVGRRPAVGVLGPDTTLMKGRFHLAACGLGQLGYPVSQLVLRRLGETGRLCLHGACRLLYGGAVLRLARELGELFVAFSARPGTKDEADGDA